mmetsp:Transcript_79821/g.191526  ORF Transcript_79821/g.191526 Transcript_79821/m.191526 type:complete len:697 (+) Transcript_79821:73-2163(+)|eukprot:CAMPEP_0181435988 /NCGR_PEP_ID=MMETSP1110-20121109/20615_1 /TAXON_ID=174948 /ORGANISM="Symbiodinium sp., Strain CCMP421" /LENGTH=696 /DNA_ID=CAMNT_0023559537 /DNA_START=62 /DNA_END=2152 /DNA_ORIENTATION=+
MDPSTLDPMRQYEKWGDLDLDSVKDGFGPCLWNVEAQRKFKEKPSNGAETILQVLQKTKEKLGDQQGVGWRNVVKVHQIEDGSGTKREKIELENKYNWMSYNELFIRTENLAKGMAALGVEPESRVVIYAETQRDWMVSAYAAWQLNCKVVTIYATLGEEGASYGINETEASTVVVDAKLLKVLSKILPKCKSIKRVFTMTECDATVAKTMQDAGVHVETLEECVTRGSKESCQLQTAKPSDIAIIMYTSGTTGAPKGVLLTHANVVAVVAGVEHYFTGKFGPGDVYLAYLPLAHIFEMAAQVCMMSMGLAIGYGTPHTLTDNGVKLKRPESSGDAPVLQPTIMVFAPAVLDKVYQAVTAKRNGLGYVGQTLFDWGLSSGYRHFERGQVGANFVLDALVFKKVQNLMGGRLKGIATGSAPLSPDIQKFIQTVLNAPTRQGYGLTETCAGSCVQFWGDSSTGAVGVPTVCTTIRLADWPDGNYMNSDLEKPEIGMRRGEVLIGGPSVSQGYFISETAPNEELVKKNEEDWVDIDGVRFFRTGDIGQIKPDNTLQIIDRKKDLWKGPNGEYVALTKVEAVLKLCEYVDMPMCYGKTGGSYTIGLICPQKPAIEKLASELQLSGTFDEFCKNEKVVDKVLTACKAKCKESKLLDFETPQRIGLISDLWTPENDMLTAAMKLKRPLIAEKHKEEIQKLYA